MKYNEVLGLKKGYHPVYDLENETPELWKRFIPNETFYKVLLTTLDSLEPTSGQQKKRSIWLRGTYGTGKSHAASVIKHMFWENLTDIEEYIEDLDVRYSSRLKTFRQDKKIFPVVIKGASNIIDNRSFSAVVQKAVTKALKESDITLATKNDFESAINFIETNKAHIDWERRIQEDENLRIYVKNKEDLIKKLNEGNVEILQMLDQSSSKAGYRHDIQNITDWLKEIIQELKKKGIADYLMIYWDEFTSILDLEQKGVSSTEWQSIAELSRNDFVYLFLITHRFPVHYSVEDQKKVLARFNRVDYVMEPLTTYHIMDGAIKKIDKPTWEELKRKHMESDDNLVSLIKRLTDNEGASITNTIINLFPIHPYTSYLLTFISRHIGSTQRSVFEFLHDEEHGFINFIDNNPIDNQNLFLTPERLWDFFLDEFEDEQKGMAGPILERYKNNIEKIREQGDEYTTIFKAILLLNILKQEINIQEVNAGRVQPSEDNIKDMFIGSDYFDAIDDVLRYLNETSIIQKNPFNIFEITASTLDAKKVALEIERLRDNFDLLKTFDSYQEGQLNEIFVNDVLRQCNINLFNANINETQLNSKLHRIYGESGYSVEIALFLAEDDTDIIKSRPIINKISGEEDFKDVLFVLSEEPLKKQDLERYLNYKARSNIAGKLDILEEKKFNEELAEKIIDNWIDGIRKQFATWVFRGENKRILARELSTLINTDISTKLYSCGLENTPAKQPATIWLYQKSPKSIETTLYSPNRNTLNTTSGQWRQLKYILCDSNQDWIVDSNLNIKNDADKSHPILRADYEINQAIDGAHPHRFHLGEVLSVLSKPPFGFYKNMVNQAAMGFLMRKYINCLYESGTGHPVDKPLMRDKIQKIFEFWESADRDRGNFLEVRLSSQEEIDLISKLKETFKIDEEAKGLNDVKWKIRDYVKAVGFPLWVYQEHTDNSTIKTTINKIHNFIRSSDQDIDESAINDLLQDLELNQLELMAILTEKNTGKDGFLKWLQKIEGFETSDVEDEERFSDLMSFIRGELQEEEPFWEDTKVENSVLKWKLRIGKTGGEGESGEGTSVDVSGEPLTTDEVKTVQKTLDDFQNTGGELKKIIIQLVKDYPGIWKILKEYLEDAL